MNSNRTSHIPFSRNPAGVRGSVLPRIRFDVVDRTLPRIPSGLRLNGRGAREHRPAGCTRVRRRRPCPAAQSSTSLPPKRRRRPPPRRRPRRTPAARRPTSSSPPGPSMRKTQHRTPPPPTNLPSSTRSNTATSCKYKHPDGTMQKFDQWKSYPNDAFNLVNLTNKRLKDGNNYQYATKPLASKGFDPGRYPHPLHDRRLRFRAQTDAEVENLRKFLLDGGTIIFNAARGREEFSRAVAREIAQGLPAEAAHAIAAGSSDLQRLLPHHRRDDDDQRRAIHAAARDLFDGHRHPRRRHLGARRPGTRRH